MSVSTLGLQLVSLIVRDYDEAIAFFVGKLGFEMISDEPAVTSHSGKPKRWVVVKAPGEEHSCRLLLARAEGAEQEAAIGKQWAGRVGLFWQVQDFDSTYRRLQRVGVKFTQEPREEVYGKVVVFEDIAGNKWDLLG